MPRLYFPRLFGGGGGVIPPAPSTPTLSVSNNGDGSGGVATITAQSGTTNTLYAAPLVGSGSLVFSLVGSRSGNGTIAIDSPAPFPLGTYVFQVLSTLGGPDSSASTVASLTNVTVPISMTEAIQTLWSTVPVQSPALPRFMFFVEVPDDLPQLPIVVYQHQGETPIPSGYPTGAPWPVMVDGKFSMVLYGVDLPTLTVWAQSIMGTFTPKSLQSIGGGPNTVMFRTNYVEDAVGLREYSGSPVRSITLSYLVKISSPGY